MTRIAVLDDYQNVALEMTDWSILPSDVEVQVFPDHLKDEDAVAQRLKDFEIVMAMRERTPFQRSLLEKLPKLRLLTTTGMRNAAIDLDAAAQCGVLVCGTSGVMYPTAELTWGLILALLRHIPREDQAVRAGEWQVSMGQNQSPGNFYAPHGIWADSRGDLYVGEVNYSAGGKQGLIPLDGHVLQKFVRLNK